MFSQGMEIAVALNGFRFSVNLSFRNSHWSFILSNDIMNLITFSEEIGNYVKKKKKNDSK